MSYRDWLDERKIARGPWVTRPAPVDTDRMAETALAGSGRSLGSAVPCEDRAGAEPTAAIDLAEAVRMPGKGASNEVRL